MRYALRNQHKIAAAYSSEMLKRIVEPLNSYFKSHESMPESDCKQLGDEPYKTLIISDAGHSTNLIAFYVIGIKYDVYRLAFKEFIG